MRRTSTCSLGESRKLFLSRFDKFRHKPSTITCSQNLSPLQAPELEMPRASRFQGIVSALLAPKKGIHDIVKELRDA